MSLPVEEGALRAVPALSGISQEARRRIASGAIAREWKAGGVLWREGRPALGLHIVTEGRVRIIRSSGGRTYMIHHEGPGTTLGEVALFDGGTYPASAVATTHLRCLVVPDAVLRSAMAIDPGVATALLAGLARRVRLLVGRLHGATIGSVRSRLAAHLLARSSLSRSASFTLAGTQAQVAEELGTVREVLARELASLRDGGVLRSLGRGRWAIADEAALEAMARP